EVDAALGIDARDPADGPWGDDGLERVVRQTVADLGFIEEVFRHRDILPTCAGNSHKGRLRVGSARTSASVVSRNARSTMARALSRRRCSGQSLTPWAVRPSGHWRMRPMGSTAFTTSRIVMADGALASTIPPPRPRREVTMPA